MNNNKLTTEFKLRIVEAIESNSFKYKSNRAQAVSLELNPAQFSRILKHDLDKVLSDSKWLKIARKYNVSANPNELKWQTAKTEVYNYIYTQLELCQDMGVSGIFCDVADIGKSFTAKDYVSRHRNAIYVDCSQSKSRTSFLKSIAREFGIDHIGRLSEIRKDLIQYMKAMTKPLIILDEAGDLDYPAFLEIKALWNATEYSCGWYMMGADGLKQKIERNRTLQKVGFSEIFSRLGNRYQRVTPVEEKERKKFLSNQAVAVARANQSAQRPAVIASKALGSLRRVRIEVIKEHQQKTATIEA